METKLVQELISCKESLVFFLPLATRPKTLPKFQHPNIKKFWHTGIIHKGKVFETFNFGGNSVGDLAARGEELVGQRAVFIRAPLILEGKLKSEIKSGTSCDEFVLRVIGVSERKGDDKGNMFPDDVFTLLSLEKFDIMPFPASYKQALLRGSKNMTLRTRSELGKYKEGMIYEAVTYSGKSLGVKVIIKEIIPTILKYLEEKGIPGRSVEALKKKGYGAGSRVDIVKFDTV